MSYILDALKKAEHERTQQHSLNTSTLFSSKSAHSNTVVSHKILVYISIAMMNILLIVGLFLFYKQSNDTEIPVNLHKTNTVKITEEKPMPLVSTGKNNTPPTPAIEEIQQTTENKREINNNKAAISSGTASLKQHAQLEPASSVSLPVSSTIKNNKLYFLNELPSNIQNTLPKLEINVHVYSAVPKQRFVLLNGKQYTEGTPIAKDLRVKEIQPDTVIFQYKSYKFKLLRP